MDNFTLFFTATIMDWKQLLKPDAHKKIIMDSLKFLVEDKRIFLYAFVIMPNHIHLLWDMQENHKINDVQRDFLKYTAQQIKFRLINTNPFLLSQFRTAGSDREYQFWQRNSFNKRVYNIKVFEQKLDYIHFNPIQDKWRLVKNPEDYHYSSARYYLQNIDDWGFITHYHDHMY